MREHQEHVVAGSPWGRAADCPAWAVALRLRVAVAVGITLAALAVAPTAEGQPPAKRPKAAAAQPAATVADVAAPDAAPPDVEAVVAAARRKADGGATAEAIADLRAANALVKQARGATAPELLPILDLAADLLFADGQFEPAESALKRAVAIREALAAEGVKIPPQDLAGSLALLGATRVARGGFADARPLLARAVELFSATLGKADPATIATLLRLGEVDLGLGATAAAEGVFRDALERCGDRGGAAAETSLLAAAGLARSLAAAGRQAAAADALADALDARRRASGDGPEIAPMLRELAELRLAAGDATGAAAAADDAADIDRNALGDAHAATITDRLLRLRAGIAGGEDLAADDAEPLAALLAAAAAAGEPLAGAGLRCAARGAMELQDADTARRRWEQALDADTRLLGDDHPDVAADRTGLARCLLAEGATPRARELATRAMEMLAGSRGPAHAETLEAMTLAGEAAAAEGDLAAAAPLLDAVLAAEAPRVGPHADRDLARLVDGVAALEEKGGNAAAAADRRKAVVALRRKRFGAKAPELAALLVALADARQDAGAPAAAVPLYKEALLIVENVHGADHPEVAAILAPLGRSLRAADEHAAAAGQFSRALAIWEATLGPDHQATLATVKALALAWLAAGREDDALPLMKRLLAGYDADPTTPPIDVAKLVRKLGQIHRARGDTEIAKAYLDRADQIEKAIGKGVPGGAPAPRSPGR